MNQQQSNLEKLKFKIGLSGTYWDKKPQYTILIDNKIMAAGKISAENDVVEYVSLECELEEDQEHNIAIRLENKQDSDTVKNPSSGDPYVIEKDMLLNICSIEIDEFNLDDLLWTSSEFTPDDPDRPKLLNCVNLGWNGTYVLKFTCPVYFWLLEKL